MDLVSLVKNINISIILDSSQGFKIDSFMTNHTILLCLHLITQGTTSKSSDPDKG